MHAGQWFPLGLLAVVVVLALYHLTRGWRRPMPRLDAAVTAAGWVVVILVAVYAVFDLHRGE